MAISLKCQIYAHENDEFGYVVRHLVQKLSKKDLSKINQLELAVLELA